jgi:hypothetical protein
MEELLAMAHSKAMAKIADRYLFMYMFDFSIGNPVPE